MAGWIFVRAGQDSPEPRRRAFLGLSLGASLTVLGAGCSRTGDQPGASPSAAAGASADADASSGTGPSTGSSTRSATDADESARAALLADVSALSATVGSATSAAGPGTDLLLAVATGLTAQASALSPAGAPASPASTADATAGPSSARPTSAGPATAEQVVEALGAAAAAATALLPGLSGGMARLVAALSAGHAVAASSLAATLGASPPVGAPPAPVDAAGTRTDVPLQLPAASRGEGGALSTARDVEAQARYAYGAAAVHLAAEALLVALSLRAVHDDAVGALDTAIGGAPSAALPREVYLLPSPLGDDTSAATLCADVEDACADAWADVVAAAGGQARTLAAAVLVQRAQQGARWRFRLGRGAALVPLPGLSGRA